jgi:D-alanine-D-alanine ligase
MGDKALGAIEICPKDGFYDYTAKYTDGKAIHKMPAPIGESAYQQALDLALKAHQTIKCRGVSRVDIRYDDKNNRPEVLEVNTQPGMTSLSLVPEIAAYMGYSFPDLVTWMVENAACGK